VTEVTVVRKQLELQEHLDKDIVEETLQMPVVNQQVAVVAPVNQDTQVVMTVTEDQELSHREVMGLHQALLELRYTGPAVVVVTTGILVAQPLQVDLAVAVMVLLLVEMITLMLYHHKMDQQILVVAAEEEMDVLLLVPAAQVEAVL
jgi:hypothetical protein